MIDGTHLDDLFSDSVFIEHLHSYGVPLEEHRHQLEECVLRVLSEMMNKRILIEHARIRGIKNYKNISKRKLLEELWNPLSGVSSNDVSSIKPTIDEEQQHEQKKKKRKVSFPEMLSMEIIIPEIETELELEPDIESASVSIPMTETVQNIPLYVQPQTPPPLKDPSRCPVCEILYTYTECSYLNRYCQTTYKYTQCRVPDAVYDSFFDRWLPVNPKQSQLHYKEIEAKRTKLRCFDVMEAKRTRSEATKYKTFLEELQKYYPSLMTQRQKDFIIGYKHGVMVESIDEDMVALSLI